jgi:hypothetical protein
MSMFESINKSAEISEVSVKVSNTVVTESISVVQEPYGHRDEHVKVQDRDV